MAKFNTAAPAMALTPARSESIPTGLTPEGGVGYQRDAKSELFLTAVSHMAGAGEATFYETADDRDTRFRDLIAAVAVEDPDWIAQFVPWLRGTANLRTASIVAAVETARAWLSVGWPGSRAVIASAIQRADEPGEVLAYWTSRYGRAIPKPVKRGVGDAVLRLGTEFNYVKWDSESRGWQFADILNVTHPGDRRGSAQSFRGDWQRDLFAYIVRRPHDPATPIPESLTLLTRRAALLSMPVDERRHVLEDPETLARAGITWEALAGWLQGPMDAEAWEAIIPAMGYMALLRNLRNFDEAKVSDAVAVRVAAKLADPEEVARSRQFPMRFLSAYNAAGARWHAALEAALGHSLRNIPAAPGPSLVLIDTSGSMDAAFSRDGSLKRWDAAAVFGLAFARRAEYADVVSFSAPEGYYGYSAHGMTVREDTVRGGTKVFPRQAGETLLAGVRRFARGYFIGGGTDTLGAIRQHYRPGFHDRVLILTDEQHNGAQDPTAAVDPSVPVYTWNLAGYRRGHGAAGPNRYTFGGLTDAGFRMVDLLERSPEDIAALPAT